MKKIMMMIVGVIVIIGGSYLFLNSETKSESGLKDLDGSISNILSDDSPCNEDKAEKIANLFIEVATKGSFSEFQKVCTNSLYAACKESSFLEVKERLNARNVIFNEVEKKDRNNHYNVKYKSEDEKLDFAIILEEDCGIYGTQSKELTS